MKKKKTALTPVLVRFDAKNIQAARRWLRARPGFAEAFETVKSGLATDPMFGPAIKILPPRVLAAVLEVVTIAMKDAQSIGVGEPTDADIQWLLIGATIVADEYESR